jgi:hypothetical protein
MAINYKLVTATSDASSPDTVFTATAVATHVKSIRIANESGGALTYHLAVYDNSATTEVPLTVPATSLPDDDVDLMVEPINLQNGDYIKLYSSGAGVKVALTMAENTDVAGATTADDLAEGTTNLYLTSAERTKLSGIATGAEVNQNAFSNIAVSGQTTVAADAKTDTFTLVAGTGVTLTTDAGADSITIAASASNSFETLAVAGQTSIVADSSTDTLTIAAGTGITLTTNATTDTLTITNSATGANAFGSVAVAGQTTVEADSTGDTLTLVSGTGVNITTNAGADSITIASTINSFSNIAVSGQSNVVAGSAGDTLTLVAAGGMTITTASGTDTITFDSARLDDDDVTLSGTRTIELNGEELIITSASANVVEISGGSAVLPSTTIRSTDGAVASAISLFEAPNNGGAYITLQAPAQLTASTTFTLPSADGTNAQVLQTNGSGTLSFVSLMTTAATASVGAYLELKEAANNGTNYIRLQAPATLAADKTYTLPATDGSNGDRLTTDGSGTLSWSAVTTGASYSTVRTQSGTTYTLVLGDAGDYIQTTSTTAVTITVPTQASVTWAADTEIYFEQNNTGQVTFVGASGVTINSSETLKTFARYSVVALKRVASDVWTLTGERALV